MNEISTLGGLIPMWILGAGLVLAVIERFKTPAPNYHTESHNTLGRPAPMRRPVTPTVRRAATDVHPLR